MGDVVEMVRLGDAVQMTGLEDFDVTDSGKYILAKGDDEDHALVALDLMRRKYTSAGGPVPVFAEGAWWAYNARRGVWGEVGETELNRLVLTLKRVSVWETRDGLQRPSLTSARVKSICAMMQMLRHEEDFFKVKCEGVAFGNMSLLFDASTEQPKRAAHNHEHRLRTSFNFELTPKAPCPKWLEFLDQVFEPDHDAAEKIQMIQEFLGATLRGEATLYQRVLMLVGEGSNGKSVLCDVVSMLFERSKCAVPPQQLSNRENRASLVGARLNLVSDMPVKGFKDSDGFKLCVAGDELSARRLFGQETLFRPIAGHLYSANQLPTVPDLSFGFFRRFLCCTFNRTFVKSEQRPRLEMMREFRAELPGITLWALRGARELSRRGGYAVPASSEYAAEKWAADNNNVKQFFMDACMISGELQFGDDIPDDWSTARDVFQKYQRWADYNGYKPCGTKTFTDRFLKITGVEGKRSKHDPTVWYSVVLRDDKQWGNPQMGLF